MDSPNFLTNVQNFLYNPATWISSVLTSIFFLIKPWYERRKPATKIVCQEVRLDDMLRVGQAVVKDLDILYKGHKVATLSRYELEIYNSSYETIKNVEIEIDFGMRCHILTQTLETNPEQTSEYKSELKQDGRSKTKLSLSYLNKYKGYGHKVYLKFLCDASLDNIRISGQGEGWSIVRKRVSLTQSFGEVILGWLANPDSWLMITVLGFVTIMFAGVSVSFVVNQYLSTELRAIRPVILAAVAACWVLLMTYLRLKAKRSSTWARQYEQRRYLLARNNREIAGLGDIDQGYYIPQRQTILAVQPAEGTDSVRNREGSNLSVNQVRQRAIKRKDS